MPENCYSRISITLPPEVLAAADRLAKRLDRPRSWVFAEAVRRLSGSEGATVEPSIAPRQPAPQSAPPLPESRSLGRDELARLQADMELTSEERVRAAEERARTVPPASRRPGDQILFFNRFEEYIRWDERSRSAS